MQCRAASSAESNARSIARESAPLKISPGIPIEPPRRRVEPRRLSLRIEMIALLKSLLFEHNSLREKHSTFRDPAGSIVLNGTLVPLKMKRLTRESRSAHSKQG